MRTSTAFSFWAQVGLFFLFGLPDAGAQPCQDPDGLAGEDQTVCWGETTEIGCSPNPDYCYLWEPSFYFDNPYASSQIVSPEISYEFQLFVTDGNGNLVNADQVYVDVIEPELEVTPSPGLICDGNPVVLEANQGFLSYEWTDETGTILSTNYTLSTAVSGSYFVTVESVSGCIWTEEVKVLLSSDPNTIHEYLLAQGFIEYQIDVLGDIPTLIGPGPNSLTPNVEDCSELIVQLDENGDILHLPRLIQEDLNVAISDGFSAGAKIFDYSLLCLEGGSCDFYDFLNGVGLFDFSVQAYIYDHPTSSADKLFVKYNSIKLELIASGANDELDNGAYGVCEYFVPPMICPITPPNVNYFVGPSSILGYSAGFICDQNDSWVEQDATKIRFPGPLNINTNSDDIWNDTPDVYCIKEWIGNYGETCTSGVPSFKAYLYVSNETPTTTLESKLTWYFYLNLPMQNDHQNVKEMLLEHFIEGYPLGNGGPDDFNENTPIHIGCNESDITRDLFETSGFAKVANQVRIRIGTWFVENEDLNGLFVDLGNFLTPPDGYGVSNSISIRKPIWAGQIYGGLQSLDIEVISFIGEEGTSGQFEINGCNVRLQFFDTFGAGYDDGGRVYFPGLVELFVLQHFRNFDTSGSCNEAPCYVPYTHSFTIPYFFSYE